MSVKDFEPFPARFLTLTPTLSPREGLKPRPPGLALTVPSPFGRGLGEGTALNLMTLGWGGVLEAWNSLETWRNP